MKFTGTLLQSNVVNQNGIMYSPEALKKMKIQVVSEKIPRKKKKKLKKLGLYNKHSKTFGDDDLSSFLIKGLMVGVSSRAVDSIK